MITTSGHVINNNYNIINNFVGCPPNNPVENSKTPRNQEEKCADSVPV